MSSKEITKEAEKCTNCKSSKLKIITRKHTYTHITALLNHFHVYICLDCWCLHILTN